MFPRPAPISTRADPVKMTVGVYLGHGGSESNILFRLLNIGVFPILTIRMKIISEYLKCEKAL